MSLDHDSGFVKSDGITQDAFLGGKIHLMQPKSGFRAGIDSVLLGASVASNTSRLLDLGCGAGAASLCAMARLPRLSASLAEINPDLGALAARNIAENGMQERAKAIAIDVTASGAKREAAGLVPDHFSSVIANPPFFDEARGTSAPESGRAGARAMAEGKLDDWVRTAAACVAPKGEVIFIYRASGLAELLDSFGRFGNVMVWPICSRAGEDANRVLVRGIKGVRSPMALRFPLIMHGAEGHAYTNEMQDVFREGIGLDW